MGEPRPARYSRRVCQGKRSKDQSLRLYFRLNRHLLPGIRLSGIIKANGRGLQLSRVSRSSVARHARGDGHPGGSVSAHPEHEVYPEHPRRQGSEREPTTASCLLIACPVLDTGVSLEFILSAAPPSDTPSFSHPSADSTLSSWTCTKPLSSTYNLGVERPLEKRCEITPSTVESRICFPYSQKVGSFLALKLT